MNLRKISLLLVLVLVIAGLVACGNQGSDNGGDRVEPPVQDVENDDQEEIGHAEAHDFPLEIEDRFGNIVAIEEAPERIISLAPSHTEILYALGLGDKIVGVTDFCDYPEQALQVEKIGDYSATNFEKIIELEPDLIVNYGELDPDASQIYSGANIPVISFEPESIDEVIYVIKHISIATDTFEQGNALVKNMQKHREEILTKVEDTEPVRVFYEIWHEPLMAAGAGSFMDSLITQVNGDNVAKDAEGEYANYDVERLVENDPEIYLTASMAESDLPEVTVESISQRPGYENISAIKNGNVYLLDGNIISRPGPRIVEGLEIVARAIHPQVFE